MQDVPLKRDYKSIKEFKKLNPLAVKEREAKMFRVVTKSDEVLQAVKTIV